MILLDTDVMVDVLRGHEPALAWLKESGIQEVGLPGLVAMELLQGCQNLRQQKALQKRIKGLGLFWASAQDCDRALADFSAFYLSHQLGILDALIGETAIGLGADLATFNVKHYSVLGGLKLIQPYLR